MVDEENVVNVGDVYTNLDLDLTYRVVELRQEDGDRIVTVETLEEGVETYRTVNELTEMIEKGVVVEADVDHNEFEGDEEVEFELDFSVSDNTKYIKGGAIVLLALFLSAVLLPVAGIFLKIAAKFLVPVAIVALGAYLMYRMLSERDRV